MCKKGYEEPRRNDIDIGSVQCNISNISDSDYEPSGKCEATEELSDGDLDRSIYEPEEMLECPNEMERTLNDLS